MTNNATTCDCGSCAGATCACGCQNTAVPRRAGCQCGEPCCCGDTCNCGSK